MGWFFLPKFGKKKSARVAKTMAPRKPWDPRRTLMLIQVLGVVVVLGGIGWGWNHAERALVNYVEDREARLVKASQIELVDAPAWMPKALKRDLCHTASNQLTNSPLDHASLQRAADALRKSPWIERIERVERLATGQVTVHAVYREPVAMVQVKEQYHLVDAQGVRLPYVYPQSEAGKVGLPIITGVDEKNVDPIRQQWRSAELDAGLSLVMLLRGEPYLTQIEAFDVHERDTNKRVRLVMKTKHGMVRWGLPPGQEGVIEQDAQTKKAWLATLHKRCGMVDAGGKIVEVYGGDIFVQQSSADDEPGQEATVSAGYTLAR